MKETEIKTIRGRSIADVMARKNKADKAGWRANKYIGTDENGNLVEKDAPTAIEVGALPASTKIPEKTSDLTNNSGFITKAVADLVNYYTKTETYTQAEINALVSAIPKFTISVVSALPTTGISTTTVYLVKSGTGGDLYTEYIYVNGAWEILGSQRVDLTGYATESWVTLKLTEYLPTAQLTAAINTALTQAKESGEFDGAPGEPGVSPTVSVSTITGGHRITITDKSSTKTVDVMDGADGDPGEPGDPGRGIVSVIRTSGTGAAGTTDTYTITYTDNTTSTFGVYNGKDGAPYILTDADKAVIAEAAAKMVDVPDVDDTLKVSGAAADAAKTGAEIDSLSKAIADKADGIIETATGEVIAVSDSADAPLRGLVVYGKSTQDGTPTPDAPVPIVSAFEDGGGVGVYGANLIPFPYYNYSATKNGVTWTINADGSVSANGTATNTSTFYLIPEKSPIHFLPGEYFFKCNGENYSTYFGRVVQIHSDGSYINLDDQGNGTKVTLIDGDKIYILLRVQNGQTISNVTFKPMLNAGSTALPYEPSKPVQTLPISTPDGLCGIPVSSGGNYTDANGQRWVCDEVDFVKGVRVQRIKAIVLNGTESWLPNGTFSGEIAKYYIKLTNPGGGKDIISSALRYGNAGEANTSQINVASLNSAFGDLLCDVSVTEYPTITDWRTYLNDNPMTIMYIRATPIETPLTESELAAYAALHTNYPNTTIYADDNAGLSVNYSADTKHYIDKKFAELASAIVNN